MHGCGIPPRGFDAGYEDMELLHRFADKLHRFSSSIQRFSEITGRAVAWLTLAMVVITFLVVVLRYGFDLGSIALQESVTYIHALVFMGAAAYTLRHDAHVRVDIFYRGLSRSGRAWVDLLGTLLLLWPMTGFILWSSVGYVAASWSVLEESPEAGGLPLVFLLKSLIPLLAVTLFLQGVVLFTESLTRILAGNTDRQDTL